MTTRRQHYVWRHYLRAWADNEQIWCRRNGKTFQTNLMNIGQQRDFYAIRSLSDKEAEWILDQAKHRHKGDLSSHNKKFIQRYKFVADATTRIDDNEKLESLRIAFEEDLMTEIEGSAIEHLSMLQRGDCSFFLADTHRASFSNFLMIQFLRTKRMEYAITNNLRAPLSQRGLNIENIWPPYKYINAGHMALTVFSEKKYKISLIQNSSNTEFITGDQPIFNIHAMETSDNVPTETALYYPVSPRLAIILSKEDYASHATENEVIKYNSLMEIASHEQIYSSSSQFL